MAKKRGRGEGSVKKLQNGQWRGQIMDGYTDEGKRNIVSFSAATKAEILQKMRQYWIEKENNLHIDRKILFKDWAEEWYADLKGQIQDSTYSGYQYTLNILKDYFGKKKLVDIIPLDINKFYRKVEEKYSSSYLRKFRAMLIQIFDFADDNGIISRNPARHSKVIKDSQPNQKPQKKKKKDAFNEEEIRILLEKLPDNMLGNSIRLLLGTGMRSQELLALTKEDIADDGSTITINKAVKTVDGKSKLGPPKSELSERIIPVPDEYRSYALYIRKHEAQPFLWTLSYKNPLCGVETFRRKYKKEIKKIDGVRVLTPHCCRHTYITRLQAKGVPMETISRLAGHSNTDTTDGYLHVSLDTLAQAAAKLNSKKEEDAA